MKVVILCGGGGTRLWPMSREQSPKQFHRLVGDYSLLQETVRRISKIIPSKDIFLSTNARFVPEIKFQLLGIPEANIIVEPAKMDNSAAIGLSLLHVIEKMKTDEPVAFLAADHLFANEKGFLDVIKKGEKFCITNKEQLLTIGVRPTFPATTYGYIKMASTELEKGIHKVDAFVEKPNVEKAQAYAASWEYLWNLGIFMADSQFFYSLFQKHLPETYTHLEVIKKTIGTPEYSKVLKKEYSLMKKISIDYGIIEKMDAIAVIPADELGWTDIGNWRELSEKIEERDEAGNNIKGMAIIKDCTNSLVFAHGKRVIAAKGLKDMIVVDTEDALLILPKSEAPNIKELLTEMKEREMNEYL